MIELLERKRHTSQDYEEEKSLKITSITSLIHDCIFWMCRYESN